MSKFEGFFVSVEVHERKVTLADGSEHVLHFRELPVTEFRRFALAERSEDADVRVGSMSQLIAASLCEPDGTPAMTFEQAARLKPAVATALFEAALSVSGTQAAQSGNA